MKTSPGANLPVGGTAKEVRQVHLENTSNGHNKFYDVVIFENFDAGGQSMGYTVYGRNGAIGSSGVWQEKIGHPVSLDKAERAINLVVNEKTTSSKGYHIVSDTGYPKPKKDKLADLANAAVHPQEPLSNYGWPELAPEVLDEWEANPGWAMQLLPPQGEIVAIHCRVDHITVCGMNKKSNIAFDVQKAAAESDGTLSQLHLATWDALKDAGVSSFMGVLNFTGLYIYDMLQRHSDSTTSWPMIARMWFMSPLIVENALVHVCPAWIGTESVIYSKHTWSKMFGLRVFRQIDAYVASPGANLAYTASPWTG